jgi:hypothetical protein
MLGRNARQEPLVARRAWHNAEKRVIWRGFWGRVLIAVEPFAIAIFFAFLTIALIVRQVEGAFVIAPIFGVATIPFLAYAFYLMLPATRAALETFGPIFIVDGYVRYTSRIERNCDIAYGVEVLDHARNVLGRWPLNQKPSALGISERWAALVEFTPYGGILRIDGRPTGVLPGEMPAFGIGAPDAYARSTVRP